MDCDQCSTTVSETFAQRDLLELIRLRGDYSYHDFLQCFIWFSVNRTFFLLSCFQSISACAEKGFLDTKNFDRDANDKSVAQRGKKKFQRREGKSGMELQNANELAPKCVK